MRPDGRAEDSEARLTDGASERARYEIRSEVEIEISAAYLRSNSQDFWILFGESYDHINSHTEYETFLRSRQNIDTSIYLLHQRTTTILLEARKILKYSISIHVDIESTQELIAR